MNYKKCLRVTPFFIVFIIFVLFACFKIKSRIEHETKEPLELTAIKWHIKNPSGYYRYKDSNKDKVATWLQGKVIAKRYFDFDCIESPYTYDEWLDKGRQIANAEEIILDFFNEDVEWTNRNMLLENLCVVATNKSIQPLLAIAKNNDFNFEIRSDAVLVLGTICHEDTLSPLIDMAESIRLNEKISEDKLVFRQNLIISISEIIYKKSKSQNTEDDIINYVATKDLSSHIETLKDKTLDSSLRSKAAMVLEEIGDHESLKALIDVDNSIVLNKDMSFEKIKFKRNIANSITRLFVKLNLDNEHEGWSDEINLDNFLKGIEEAKRNDKLKDN